LITENVRRLLAPPKGSRITYDHVAGDDPRKTVAGFGARITAAGAVSFILNYYAAGIERRLTIGSFPTWSVSQAREKARELRQLVDDGRDPLAEHVAARAAPTVRDLARRYLAEHAVKKRSRNDDEGILVKWVVPELGAKKVTDVRYSDIAG